MNKVNLEQKFALFYDHWHPRLVAEVNDSYVKVAKLRGEFVWHRHEGEDEMFLVIKGSLIIKFRDGHVTLNAGEFVVIPKGVEHCPVAEEEVHVMLIEPKSTLHTGNVKNERTVEHLEWI